MLQCSWKVVANRKLYLQCFTAHIYKTLSKELYYLSRDHYRTSHVWSFVWFLISHCQVISKNCSPVCCFTKFALAYATKIPLANLGVLKWCHSNITNSSVSWLLVATIFAAFRTSCCQKYFNLPSSIVEMVIDSGPTKNIAPQTMYWRVCISLLYEYLFPADIIDSFSCFDLYRLAAHIYWIHFCASCSLANFSLVFSHLKIVKKINE